MHRIVLAFTIFFAFTAHSLSKEGWEDKSKDDDIRSQSCSSGGDYISCIEVFCRDEKIYLEVYAEPDFAHLSREYKFGSNTNTDKKLKRFSKVNYAKSYFAELSVDDSFFEEIEIINKRHHYERGFIEDFLSGQYTYDGFVFMTFGDSKKEISAEVLDALIAGSRAHIKTPYYEYDVSLAGSARVLNNIMRMCSGNLDEIRLVGRGLTSGKFYSSQANNIGTGLDVVIAEIGDNGAITIRSGGVPSHTFSEVLFYEKSLSVGVVEGANGKFNLQLSSSSNKAINTGDEIIFIDQNNIRYVGSNKGRKFTVDMKRF
ncbi:hypothetical protein [Roseibium sp.]|uniref:hypothetical protein n=1 Tax=Roseibium sp. TaxID=1936156 RepID=UPI003B52C8E4